LKNRLYRLPPARKPGQATDLPPAGTADAFPDGENFFEYLPG
jgi:hypothetical protein